MAYNLPPPWDPGYALPDNVSDEGLERHAYVTKWLPRGTYDAPRVGGGGYAVPGYVRAEGYGQGTYTTKWIPRGYFDLPAPHRLNRRPRVVAEGNYSAEVPGPARAVTFGDTDLHPLFTNYGTRAADILIRSVQGLPQKQAKARLKAYMDRLDPTLWGRTAQLTRGYMSKGLQGWAALRAGLATAMSAGIAAEIVRAGLSRSAPQPRSLLGLGCYGCAAALGATALELAQASKGAPLQGGASFEALQVGPWTFATTPNQRFTFTANSMTAEQKSAFASALAKASAAILATKVQGVNGIPASAWTKLDNTGLGSGMVPVEFVGNGMPIWKFTHPQTNKTMVVVGRSSGSKAAPAIELWWHEDPSLAAAIINALVTLIATLVAPVISAVSDLACSMLGNPAITIASAAAATAAGAPPAAGAAGASIAQQACGTAAPPVTTTVSDGSSFLLPVAIIGGAALVAVLVSGKKKAPDKAAP